MSIIDERVLAMKFDNKQFETNVQTSMSTLDKLKQKLALQGATKGLENVDAASKKVNLESVSSGADVAANRFTAMSVVAITALSNITSAAMTAGKSFISSLTIDPMKMGFQEYETQMNAIQTVLANTQSKGTTLKDVNAALDELNDYSDQTIYNFTEMARNIGTFTAAGVGLKTSTESIKGIANLAAVSGSNSQQASTAMYQLSQAIAQGSVKLMDWNSVVNAGMGGEVFQKSLIETAKVHGVNVDAMIKKEGSFRETLSKGWITSQVLTETLAKFTGDLSIEQLKSMGYTAEQAQKIFDMGQTASDAATKVKTLSQLISTLNEANQSGWTQTWEIVSGEFDEAKLLYTGISKILGDMIGASAKARNELLQGWKDLGGRTMLIDAVKNAFDGAMIVVKSFGEAFSQIFPPLTVANLMSISKGTLEFSKGLKMGSVEADQLRRVFAGVFSIFSIAIQIITNVAKAFGALFGAVVPANNGILGFLATIGDFLVGIDRALKSGQDFTVIFKAIGEAFRSLFSVFNGNSLENALKGFGAAFSGIDLGGLNAFVDGFKSRFGGLPAFITSMIDKIKELFGKLGDYLSKSAKSFSDHISFEGIAIGLNAAVLAKAIGGVVAFAKLLKGETIGIKGIKDSLKGILDGVTGSLTAMQNSLKAKTIMTIALAIGILALSVALLATIDPVRLATALTGMTVMFGELFGAFTLFEKSMKGGLFSKAKMVLVAASLIALGVALLILSAAVKTLSTMSWKELTKGLAGVIVLLSAMVVVSKTLETNSRGMIKTGLALIVIGLGIKILASAVKDLGEIDANKLAKGLLSVVVLLAAMVGVSKTLGDNASGMVSSGAALILMALGLKILVGVVRDLGAMDTKQLAKGLTSVIIALAAIALFMRTANFDSFGPGKALGIILMAAALKILASVVSDFSKLGVSGLIKGLAAVGIVLTELAMFTRLVGDQKRLILTGIALVILAKSLSLMGDAIKAIGELSWEAISKGLVTIGLALTIIVATMNQMKMAFGADLALMGIIKALALLVPTLKGLGELSWEAIFKGLIAIAGVMLELAISANAMRDALPGAAAIIIMALALSMLAPVLLAFSKMSLAEIGIGLLAMAGVFAVLGLAAVLIAPLSPALIALSLAIASLGLSLVLTGFGLLVFAAGLTAVAVAVVANGGAIAAVIYALLALIPFAATQLGQGFVNFLAVIAANGPTISSAMNTVMLSILESINTTAPAIIDTLVGLLMMMVQTLVDNVPQLVDSGMKLLLGILQGIEDNIYQITDTVIGIILKFVQAITDNLPKITDSGANLIISFVNSLASTIETKSGELRTAGGRLATAIIDGMTGGLATGVTDLAKAAANLANSALQAAKDALKVNSPSKKFIALFESVGEGAVIGTNNGQSALKSASVDLANTAIDGVKTAMSKLATAFDTNVDVTPTIRPVVDLSNVHSASSSIDGIFGGSRGIDVSATYRQAASASISGQATKTEAPSSTNVSAPTTPTEVNFTQNNYSPKALSRLEIYRQTRNQIGELKGALG